MNVIDEYLNELYNISFRTPVEQATTLANLLNLNPQINSYIVRINNIPLLTDAQLDEIIERKNLYNNEWLAFNELVISFIKLANQLNPWSLLESFDLYSQFLNDLSVAFNNNNRGQLLSLVIKSSISDILPMAIKLDYQLYYRENCTKPRLAYLASILLRMFNNVRSQMSDISENSMKKSIILFLGVKLCSVYFKISNPLLCRNIFSNMNNANLIFKSFNMNEQIQYRYYLGRFYLIKNQLPDAYQHLLWCLNKSPVLKDNMNITRILKYLIPISIVIGKRPNFAYISGLYYNNPPEFFNIYFNISNAIKLGSFRQFNQVISGRSYEFLKESNLLLMIVSKSQIIILRNLIRKVWIYSGKPTKIEYDTIKAALNLSVEKTDLGINTFVVNTNDDSTVENILITLIDQNLLKGKIFSRLRAVALSKTGVFAHIDLINFTRFGNGVEGTLNSNDKWFGYD